MTRIKSAIIVFVVLSVAGIAAISVDYTDTYVADRFYRALAAKQYQLGSPFSLDAFIEYYDWDEVYVFTPGIAGPELKTQFGLPYEHKADQEVFWSLVLVKSYYVVAEIPVKRSVLEYPLELPRSHFKRWSAIVEIVDDGIGQRMRFIGH